MHIQSVIEELGYRPHEAKIYLAALTLGESTITDLAKRVKLPRTTVQAMVENLRRTGLLNSYPKRRRIYWVAEDPDKLMIRLKEREAALNAVMPVLQGMRIQKEGRPSIRLYMGKEEIKRIMNDIIETKHHISAVVAWEEWKNFFDEDYVEDFIERRTSHFLKIRFLVPRSPAALALRKRDEQELRVTRFLPDHVRIPTTNYIYADKVAIISLNRKDAVGVLIEDPDVAETMNAFFEGLWVQSSDT